MLKSKSLDFSIPLVRREYPARLFAVVLFIAASSSSGQSATTGAISPPACSFEVASIRLSNGETFAHIKIDQGRTLHAFSFPAKSLIEAAYDLRDGQQVVGVPPWAANEKYDIIAKVSDEQAANKCLDKAGSVNMALRELLERRFAFKAHNEQRKISVYGLWVIPGKLKLKPGPGTPEQIARYPDDNVILYPPLTITGQHTSTAKLAMALSHVLDRYVIDHTGLTDRYTFKLKYSDDSIGGEAPSSAGDRPSIFTALKEQLGLNLISEKSPMPSIIVDHIERPSPN